MYVVSLFACCTNTSSKELKRHTLSKIIKNRKFYFGFLIWPCDVNMFIEMKWNESGFRPSLCTYRLNWTRRTSWGWWEDWDDTVLQTQDSKFEPWRSEVEHATSRSRRRPSILTFTRGWRINSFCFFQTAETGNRTPNSGVKGSGANHYHKAPALVYMVYVYRLEMQLKKKIVLLIYQLTG